LGSLIFLGLGALRIGFGYVRIRQNDAGYKVKGARYLKGTEDLSKVITP